MHFIGTSTTKILKVKTFFFFFNYSTHRVKTSKSRSMFSLRCLRNEPEMSLRFVVKHETEKGAEVGLAKYPSENCYK